MIKVEKLETFNFEGAFRGMRNPMESWDKSDSFFGLLSDGDDPDFEVAENYVDEKHPNIERYSVEYSELTDKYDEMLLRNGILSFNPFNDVCVCAFIGPKDLRLAQKLVAAGSDHRKFMRQIFVSMDITAPLYWWKEMDTYKVSTVANSCSTMHKLATTPITKDMFSFDDSLAAIEIPAFHTIEVNEMPPVKIAVDYSIGEMNSTVVRDCEYLRKLYLETNDLRYWRALIQLLPESWNQTRTWTANYEILRNICQARATHKLTEWREFVEYIQKNAPYAEELIFYKGE